MYFSRSFPLGVTHAQPAHQGMIVFKLPLRTFGQLSGVCQPGRPSFNQGSRWAHAVAVVGATLDAIDSLVALNQVSLSYF